MNWEDVAGQAAAVNVLRGTLATGRVAHAYLFTGPRGVGKTTAALVFAAGLLCASPEVHHRPCGRCDACRDMAAARHPDLHRVEPDGESIRIEQVRHLQRQAALRPAAGPRQLFLIEPADALGEAAQNALLKVLEEPPGSTVFVLIAHQTTPLLPTVVSRCVPVRFGRLPRDVAAAILRERFQYGQAAELGAALGDGSIWQATRWTPDALQERRAKAVALWDALAAGGPPAAVEQAQAWHERRDELLETLELLQLWLRDLLVCRQAAGAAGLGLGLVNVDQTDELTQRAQRTPEGAVLRALEAILAFRRQVQQNVNLRTAADVLFLDLAAALGAQKG